MKTEKRIIYPPSQKTTGLPVDECESYTSADVASGQALSKSADNPPKLKTEALQRRWVNKGTTGLPVGFHIIILVTILFIIAACLIFTVSNSKIIVVDDFEGEISDKTLDYGVGEGSQIKISASKEIKYHGKQAIKLEYKAVAGGYMWLARGYGLDVKGAARWLLKPQEINWPKYSALSFYMYGENSGVSIAVDIIDAGFEYFRFMVKDDFVGWKQIICPFDKFFARGDWQPSKAKTNARLDFPVGVFQFEPRPIVQGTLYFDYVHLIKKD